MTAPKALEKFKDRYVTIDPEEKKETWTASFSPAAMSRNPAISDAAKEVYGRSGGNDGSFGSVTSLAIENPDGATEFIDCTTPGFGPAAPAKGAAWALCKDEDGRWQLGYCSRFPQYGALSLNPHA